MEGHPSRHQHEGGQHTRRLGDHKLPAVKGAQRKEERGFSGRKNRLTSGRIGAVGPAPIASGHNRVGSISVNVPSSLLNAQPGWKSYPVGNPDHDFYRLSQLPVVVEPDSRVEDGLQHPEFSASLETGWRRRTVGVGIEAEKSAMGVGTTERLAEAPPLLTKGRRGRLQVRLPSLWSSKELEVIQRVMPALVGPECAMRSKELSYPLWNIPLAEKPTSRHQAQQLANWFGQQIGTLAEHGRSERRSRTLPMTESSFLAVDLFTKTMTELPPLSMAQQLIEAWDEAGTEAWPFMFTVAAHQARVEGVKVPNDRRYIQAMLQVTGAAMAAITHQVGMHCHDRGNTLSHVWNLHLALQEFDAAQQRRWYEALRKENASLQSKLADMSKAAMSELMRQRMENLQEYQDTASVEMQRLQKRNKAHTERIHDLEAEAEVSKAVHEEELDALKVKMDELEEQLAETQHQLDVSLTALYSSTEQTGQVANTVARVQAKLKAQSIHGSSSKRVLKVKESREKGETGQQEGAEEGEVSAEDLMKELSAVAAQLDTIVGMDKIAEQQLFRDLEGDSEMAAKLFEVIVANKQAGKNMTEQIAEGGDVLDADQNVIATVDADGTRVAEAILGAAQDAKVLTLDELIAKAGVELPTLKTTEPFMDDTYEMRRDEMQNEIYSLRQREQTMLGLISKMADLYHAEANRLENKLGSTAPVAPETSAAAGTRLVSGQSGSTASGSIWPATGGSLAAIRTGVQPSSGGSHQPAVGSNTESLTKATERREPDDAKRNAAQPEAKPPVAASGGSWAPKCVCGRPIPMSNSNAAPAVVEVMVPMALSAEQKEAADRQRLETMTFLAGMSKTLVASRQEEIVERTERVRNNSRRELSDAGNSYASEDGIGGSRRHNGMASNSSSRRSLRQLKGGMSFRAGAEEPRAVFMKNKGIQVELSLDLEAVEGLAEAVEVMLGDLKSRAPEVMTAPEVVELLETTNPLLQSIDENKALQVRQEKEEIRDRAKILEEMNERERLAEEREERAEREAEEAEKRERKARAAAAKKAAKSNNKAAKQHKTEAADDEDGEQGGSGEGQGLGLSTMLKMRTMSHVAGKNAKDNRKAAKLLASAMAPRGKQQGEGTAASKHSNVMSQVLEKVGKSKQAGERFRFMCKDQSLMAVLMAHPNAEPRTPEWAMKVIDAIYKLWQDKAKKDQDDSQHMPNTMMAHFTGQYGAKALVQEYAAIMVATLRKHSSTDVRLQIFSKFLSEEWDSGVVNLFLEAHLLGSAQRSVNVACIDFPPANKKQRGDSFVCTRKAAAIAEQLFGRRSEECSARFVEILESGAEATPEDERAASFWSPDHNETFEAASGVPWKRLRLHVFLSQLCAEHKRMEDVLEGELSVLYREADTDGDGFLERAEFDALLGGMEPQEDEVDELWRLAYRNAKASAEQNAEELPADTIDHPAFTAACRRAAVVRRYVRLHRTPPAAQAMDAESKEVQDKVFHLLIERGWGDFYEAMEQMLQQPLMLHEESGLRAQATKVQSETDGQHRALLFATLLKNMANIKLDAVIRACRSNEAGGSLEADVDSIQQALKVLYGWNALLEDDHKVFDWMVQPDTPMVMRSKAAAYWKRQSQTFQKYKQRVEAHASTVIRASVSRSVMGARTLKNLKQYIGLGGDDEDGGEGEGSEGGGDDNENVPKPAERRAALAAQSSKRRISGDLQTSDDAYGTDATTAEGEPSAGLRSQMAASSSRSRLNSVKSALKKQSKSFSAGGAEEDHDGKMEGQPPSRSTPQSLRFIDTTDGQNSRPASATAPDGANQPSPDEGGR